MIRHFNRFELKYVVPAALRPALLADIAPMMRSDTFGDGGAYTVSSLYYDSPDLGAFRSKLDGIRFRRKLRLRAYGQVPRDPHGKVMIEIKQRINRSVQKRRLALPLSDAYRLCEGDLNLDRSWEDARDVDTASEVTLLVRAQDLRPTCLVTYQRQAFVGGPYEPRLRLTFDRDLWCKPASELAPASAERYHFLPPGWEILEVKSDQAVPLWVSRMLARHHVPLRRFSKYCAAVSHLARQGTLSTAWQERFSWIS